MKPSSAPFKNLKPSAKKSAKTANFSQIKIFRHFTFSRPYLPGISP